MKKFIAALLTSTILAAPVMAAWDPADKAEIFSILVGQAVSEKGNERGLEDQSTSKRARIVKCLIDTYEKNTDYISFRDKIAVDASYEDRKEASAVMTACYESENISSFY